MSAKQEAVSDSTPAGVPEATLLNFLSGLGSQGLMQLGALPNPLTGERTVNLAYAQYTVQLLTVLKAKTEGHRTAEEEQYLVTMVADLTARLKHQQESQQQAQEK